MKYQTALLNLKAFCYERNETLCSHGNCHLFTRELILFSHESSPGISLMFIK